MPLDFSSGGTPVNTGVLDFSSGGTPLDFANGGTKVKKTREQVLQSVAAAQASRDVVNPPETQGLLGQVAASPITGGIVNVASLRPVMTGIGQVASFLGNTIANEFNFTGEQQPKPFVIDTVNGTISQEPGVQQPFGAGRPMVQVPLADPQARMGIKDVSALPQVLGQLVEGLTTPENVATLPLAAGKSAAGQVAATLFAPQMISGGVESGMQALDSELDPRAREEAGWNAAVNLLLGGKIGKGLLDSRPWTPEVLPPRQRPVAPAGRQLPAPEQPYIDAEVVVPPRLPAPGERPTMPVGSPLDRPAGAARFGVDPSGKAVDITQLSPKEQTELYRGPKEFVPREQYVRPAQQAPVILGEQPKPKREVVFQNETRPVQPVYVPGRAPVEPSGGEVSFRAPAQAAGIPSARQSMVQPAPLPKREVVFQNETAPIKPVYQPSAPKMEPVADAPKGMQIKAAMERGQERRGETGALFPTGSEGRPLKPYDKTKKHDVTFMGKSGMANWPHGMWLSPDGKILDASPGHYESGADFLGERKFDWQNEGANFEDSLDYVFGEMRTKGFVQLRGTTDGIEIMSGRITRTQKAALERWGIENEKKVIDNTGSANYPEVIYEPPTHGGMQIVRGMERGIKRRGETGSVFPRGDEDRVPERKEPKLEVAKLSTSKSLNPLGDPMGSTYYATPEDWGAWQKVQGDFKDLLTKGAEFDGPEMMKVRQENENIKNRYGGMPPVEPVKGGIGGGVKSAVEKNREAGSVENPFARIVDKFKNKEKEKRGDTFALSGPRIALDPKESGFKDVSKKVDAQQLWNRVKNKLTPAEKDIYEKSGVDKKIVEMGKVSPEEAAAMLQDGGVEVQTHSYGMEGKVSEAKKEYDRMTHEWYDRLSASKRSQISAAYGVDSVEGGYISGENTLLKKYHWNPSETPKVLEYLRLENLVRKEPIDNSPRATSAYDQVSAFSTKEPMPEWTKTRSGKNVQRVDVVIPKEQPRKVSYEEWLKHENRKDDVYAKTTYNNLNQSINKELWQPDNLHENLPNTLGWAMIQYKDGPKGEKVAVVVEAQSRWGQSVREDKARLAEHIKRGRIADTEMGRAGYSELLNKGDHPLLRDYNRLILKAAIDQARKEGATHIVVSDAESAMMTEGHDVAHSHVTDFIDENAKLPQESGMRLNYDTILPKIMEELSGEKGERVSLGEHKNALAAKNPIYAHIAEAERGSNFRDNLIFRNPDGTPKTDVSGTMYKIPQTDKKFSLFEKDRPESVAGRLYINPVGPMAKQALKDIKKLGNGIKETSAKLKEYFKGATDKVLPDLVFQNDNPLPDFQPKELANKIFSQPFGSEKIPVLGRVMGGKARLRTPQDDAVATWYAERHGVGPAVASSVGEQIRGQIKGVFKVSKDGDLNVKPTMPKQSLKMSDVFEALRRDPMSYDLTVPQRKVFKQIIEPITKRMSELANKYKIIDEVVDENGDFRAYYPRIVTKHPKLEDKKNTSAFKTRAFNTEKEGWDRGYEYELDPEKRLVTGVERLYRAIANKRLATDPILGAKSEVQIKAEIKQAYAEKLATGEITQSKIDRISEGIRTRGQVMQPILIRSIFDQETAKMLNKEFAAEQSTVRNAITSANSLMKATQLGFDLGVGQIQLLPLLYSNPKVWGKAMYDSAKGMANPEFFATYVRANKEAVNELAQLGSSVGRLQEHMSGLGGETILGKTPVLGQVAQAFGRQFQTAMDVAKVELWKSLREGTPKKEWPKTVRAIETILLSGRSESAMVPHGRALLERVALLAPSYYRGAVEHIASLGERGASGKVVRQSMGRFILGSAITFYAVAKALQMSDEEIIEGFNPANTSFMTWKVEQEDGSVVNIGFGGIFRSFLKLGGSLIKTSREHPENWKSLSSEKNPLSRWYRGHAGPTPSMAWDAFSGEDFMGRESSLGTLAKSRLPLLAQEAMRRPEEAKVTALDIGASMFGLSTTPENYSNRLGKEQDKMAQKMFGRSFKDLDFSERSEVEVEIKGVMNKVPRGMTEDRAVELAIRNQKETIKNIKDNLGEENRKWLEKNAIKIGGFQNTFEVKGRVIRLTKEEREVMKELMVKEYEKTLSELRVDPRLSGKSAEEMQRYVNVYLELARKNVWGLMNERAGKK